MTALFIVDRAADEAGWHAARADRVTATDVGRLVAGGMQTRRTLLAEKTNGSSFRGNADTERGNRREVIVADWVKRHFGIAPNSALWASRENALHAATPDGLGKKEGCEIKSTIDDWETDGIPQDYIDQVQWGIDVFEFERWLFVWEPIDEFGQYPLEPSYRWIERDDERIAELREAADRFIVWREDGAPLVDADISEDLDEAISQHVAARRGKKRFEEREKAAEARIRSIIAADEFAVAKGMDRSGHDGSVLYKVNPKKEFDLEAWAVAEPLVAAEYLSLTAAAAELRAAAEKTYQRDAAPGTRLTIAEHKPEKVAPA